MPARRVRHIARQEYSSWTSLQVPGKTRRHFYSKMLGCRLASPEHHPKCQEAIISAGSAHKEQQGSYLLKPCTLIFTVPVLRSNKHQTKSTSTSMCVSTDSTACGGWRMRLRHAHGDHRVMPSSFDKDIVNHSRASATGPADQRWGEGQGRVASSLTQLQHWWQRLFGGRSMQLRSTHMHNKHTARQSERRGGHRQASKKQEQTSNS